MRKSEIVNYVVLVIGLVFTLAIVAPAMAEPTSSPNFTIDEDFIGGTGQSESSSSNYSARDAGAGAIAGGSEGGSYQVDAGAVTPDEPTLSFYVSSPNVDLGSLSTSLASTGTANFSALNYTSYGYVVQVVGDPPDNGQHTLAGMSTPAASSNGTEQFGINLVANSSPSVGADPVQQPNSSFSFGAAAAGYNSANSFKYASGDVVAQAGESSGRTDYTLSFIANVSNNTPGGSYSGGQTLVITGTY